MEAPTDKERWVSDVSEGPYDRPLRVHTSRYCGHIRHHDLGDLRIIEAGAPNPVVEVIDDEDPFLLHKQTAPLCQQCQRRLD